MAVQGIVALIKVVAPKLAKYAGPELTKWLAKLKNRQALMESARGYSSRLPAERLRARINATLLVLEGIRETSEEPERVDFAREGIARARRMSTKLDLPLGSRAERRQNTRSVGDSLAKLHEDMQRHLDDEEPTD